MILESRMTRVFIENINIKIAKLRLAAPRISQKSWIFKSQIMSKVLTGRIKARMMVLICDIIILFC